MHSHHARAAHLNKSPTFEDALRDIEGDLSRVFSASIVASSLVEDAIGSSGSILAQAAATAVPALAGHKVFVLTDEQWNGLLYSLGHLDDVIREHRDAYYRALSEAA
jgi:hypothetical protein